MFEQFTEPVRPKAARAQVLYLAFFVAGTLLNAICNLSGPHHTHRSMWIGLDIAALALMLTGLAAERLADASGTDEQRLLASILV